jgi:ribonuclease P protein component
VNGVGRKQQEAQPRSGGPNSPAEGPSPALPFPRHARLLKHAAFNRVYQQGKRLFSGNMTVFFRLRGGAEESGGARVGFTVSRALGGAVQRNRLKRRLREAVRANLAAVSVPVDVVINPKRTASSAEFAQLVGEVQRAFAQIQRLGKAGVMGPPERQQPGREAAPPERGRTGRREGG